eukprot:TRINITY_DN12655_c0_g2_i1.p1 TRINITY_DN12655_c0_g2~~TRINITY_DN12655_c0_g2_i1.p1  ORF type:complete len:369 (+),score=45.62 TRINITY_DN12655_c0_g2_i1:95-1108(+)
MSVEFVSCDGCQSPLSCSFNYRGQLKCPCCSTVFDRIETANREDQHDLSRAPSMTTVSTQLSSSICLSSLGGDFNDVDSQNDHNLMKESHSKTELCQVAEGGTDTFSMGLLQASDPDLLSAVEKDYSTANITVTRQLTRLSNNQTYSLALSVKNGRFLISFLSASDSAVSAESLDQAWDQFLTQNPEFSKGLDVYAVFGLNPVQRIPNEQRFLVEETSATGFQEGSKSSEGFGAAVIAPLSSQESSRYHSSEHQAKYPKEKGISSISQGQGASGNLDPSHISTCLDGHAICDSQVTSNSLDAALSYSVTLYEDVCPNELLEQNYTDGIPEPGSTLPR